MGKKNATNLKFVAHMAWSTVGEWFVSRCTLGAHLVNSRCTLGAHFVTDKNYDKMSI
ncbi:MAG: hypothetical protein IKY64_03915 [Bacteroidaceae bacterium]|nr:hypothetical protein [Bacteroidaceae bacterium]